MLNGTLRCGPLSFCVAADTSPVCRGVSKTVKLTPRSLIR